MMTRKIIALVLGGALLAASSEGGNAENLWGKLQSEDHFVLIRHALAPGYGDPNNFDVNDCNSQRNLNPEGRLQSKRIGDLFRSNGVKKALVFSSQWCRCLDTARLLALGNVSKLPALNSFFKNLERELSQTREIRSWIKNAPLISPTVLVSHQVNISSLIGYSPSSGEIIFVERKRDGSLSVAGSIQTTN